MTEKMESFRQLSMPHRTGAEPGPKKRAFQRETAWTMQGLFQASEESMQSPPDSSSAARIQ
ncbi:MAG TPA: hypothetical protein VFB27_06060, partial [Opitutaceae bacterium]|nr:hypothetical protein [Opitutaceae bacterium]